MKPPAVFRVAQEPLQLRRISRCKRSATALCGTCCAATRLPRAWSRAGADLLMGEHIHLPYIRALHAELRERGQHTWIVQAGTAVSRRVREASPTPSTTPRTRSRPCTVERWDYAADARAFRSVAIYELPSTRDELASDRIRLP